MANFKINIGSLKLEATVLSNSTDCASMFIYSIKANANNVLKITITGKYKDAFIMSPNGESQFIGTTTVNFVEGLKLKVIIENSGNPGNFDTANVKIENLTVPAIYQNSITRLNDNPKCKNEEIATFDKLADTPNNKIGQAGKVVIVNNLETELTYINISDLVEEDKNYVHVQDIPSDEWICEHKLNKYPSVTILDSARSEVEGSVQHVSTTLAILKFTGSFTGVATFN